MGAGMEFFMGDFSPWAGVVLTNLLSLGPLYAVVQARKRGSMGSLNPLPFPLILSYTIGWVMYGFMDKNLVYVLGSLPGIILAAWYCLSCMVLMPAGPERIRIEIATITVITFWVLVGFASWFSPAALSVAGAAACTSSLVMYGAPLSTMFKILQFRDSSSINRGFLLGSILNGLLWLFYSIVERDLFLMLPSFMAVIFSVLQIALIVYCRRYPAKPMVCAVQPPHMAAVQASQVVGATFPGMEPVVITSAPLVPVSPKPITQYEPPAFKAEIVSDEELQSDDTRTIAVHGGELSSSFGSDSSASISFDAEERTETPSAPEDSGDLSIV